MGHSLKFLRDKRRHISHGKHRKKELLEKSREWDDLLRKERLESFLTLPFIFFLNFTLDRILQWKKLYEMS